MESVYLPHYNIDVSIGDTIIIEQRVFKTHHTVEVTKIVKCVVKELCTHCRNRAAVYTIDSNTKVNVFFLCPDTIDVKLPPKINKWSEV